MRRDEVEAAWSWVDNLLAGWEKGDQEYGNLCRWYARSYRCGHVDGQRRTCLVGGQDMIQPVFRILKSKKNLVDLAATIIATRPAR